MYDYLLGWLPDGRALTRVIVIVVLALALLVYIKWRENHPKVKVYKTKMEKPPFRATKDLRESKGLYLGKVSRFGKLAYIPAKGEWHGMIIGGTGTGKSSALAIPTLEHWPGGSLVVDCEGDLVRESRAERMMVWAPLEEGGVPYNIFGEIDRLESPALQNEALTEMVDLLIPKLGENASEAARYFNDGARDFLRAALYAMYPLKYDFCKICEIVCDLTAEEFLTKIMKSGNKLAIRCVRSYMGTSEKNLSSCKSTCDGFLRVFATTERLKKSLRRPAPGEQCFEVAAVTQYNVFARIPRNKLSLLSPVLRVMLSQTLHLLDGREDYDEKRDLPVLLMLDEFVTLGKLEGMKNAFCTFRKRGVRIMICVQSLIDIEGVYGREDSASIFNNCALICVLNVRDPDTQENIARIIGHHTVERVSKTVNANGTSYTSHTSEEWIVRPEDLGKLKKKFLLLYPGGHAFLWKYPYYKYRRKQLIRQYFFDMGRKVATCCSSLIGAVQRLLRNR